MKYTSIYIIVNFYLILNLFDRKLAEKTYHRKTVSRSRLRDSHLRVRDSDLDLRVVESSTTLNITNRLHVKCTEADTKYSFDCATNSLWFQQQTSDQWSIGTNAHFHLNNTNKHMISDSKVIKWLDSFDSRSAYRLHSAAHRSIDSTDFVVYLRH
jgi:hypothetical protein